MRNALLCLIVIAAVANWWSRWPGERRGARTVELISKPATTVLVILLAATADAPAIQVTLAVVALVLCLAGDVALLGPPSLFLLGLVAFAAAHLVFIALFVQFGVTHRGLAGGAIIGGAVLAATVGKIILVNARARQRTLGRAVAVYLLVILSMAVFGWGTGLVLVLVGTTAFVVSDSLIGWDAFVRPQRWLPLAIMITYHVAIVSLALAV